MRWALPIHNPECHSHPGHPSETSPLLVFLSVKNLPLMTVSIEFRHYNSSHSYDDNTDIATHVRTASGSRAKHW